MFRFLESKKRYLTEILELFILEKLIFYINNALQRPRLSFFCKSFVCLFASKNSFGFSDFHFMTLYMKSKESNVKQLDNYIYFSLYFLHMFSMSKLVMYTMS